MRFSDEEELLRYDRDLITVLNILKRVDIPQLLTDIRANDKKVYEVIAKHIDKDYFYANH